MSLDLDLESALSYGVDEAEAMGDEARKNAGGARRGRVNFLSLKDKESIILRFLEDNWPTVLQHSFVPTKDVYEGASDAVVDNWPERAGAVCRRTKGFEKFFPQGCVICDKPGADSWNGKYNPTPRLWVRAVERVKVRVESEADAEKYGRPIGTLLGIKDVEEEIDEIGADGEPTGNTIWRKKIIVVNQGSKNFFSTLKGYKEAYETVTDRDYVVTRRGEKLKTDYDIIPMDPVRREDNSIFQMIDPEIVNGERTGRTLAEVYLEHAPKLTALIERQLTDDHYAKFFDPSIEFVPPARDDDGKGKKSTRNGARTPARTTPKASSSSSASEGRTEAPSGGTGSAADRLAAIRNKVKGDNPRAEASEDASDSAEEPATAGTAPTGMLNL